MPWKLRQGSVTTAPREVVLEAATSLYAARDYADVTLGEVAAAAHTTPDSITGQFGTLADLYAEVFRHAHGLVGEQIGARLTAGDPIAVMRQGIDAFLELFSEPGNRRLLLVNAPVALGWARWRRIGDEYGSMLIDAALSDAMDKGAIADQPVKPLAYAIVGMLESSAHWVDEQPDRTAALAQSRRVLNEFLDGLVAASRPA